MNFYERQSLPVPATSIVDFADAFNLRSLEWQKRRSQSFLLESGFIPLLREKNELLHGNFGDLLIRGRQFTESAFLDESSLAEIRWEEVYGAESYSYRSVVVEAFSTGTIVVRGGFGGSTLLPLGEWKGGVAAQIKAVEKAVLRPRVIGIGA